MQIKNFKEINKGCLIATFDILFPKWGNLEIRECKLFEKGTRQWVSLPSRQFEGEGGKTCYAPFIKFDEESFTRLQVKMLDLLTPMLQKVPNQQNLF